MDDPTASNKSRNIQPFFIMHKACSRNSVVSRSKAKARRRIDVTQTEAKFAGDHHGHDNQSNLHAFRNVWSKIESTIKEVLRNINADVFDEIHEWVQESFATISSLRKSDPDTYVRSYPIAIDPLSKLLPTGLLFTKNMELVDDLLTFEELGLHLKSQGFHVANLSSFDFSAKNGIAGCLKSLLRQFMMAGFDVADLSLLSSWYAEQGSCEYPIVVIIDDMEKCCGRTLSNFIHMLSEWAVKLPVILIFGVATTVDALMNILPSNALQHLSPRKFLLGSPTERMDAIIEAVLVKQCSNFSIGHKVATFLRNHFIRQDGTLTLFIRALKIAVVQHISMEPLSVTFMNGFKDDNQFCKFYHSGASPMELGIFRQTDLSCETHISLPAMLINRAFELSSYRRNTPAEQNGELVAQGLSDREELQKLWSSVVMCLYEAGKCHDITLLDLFCEALDSDLYSSSTTDSNLRVRSKVGKSIEDHPVLDLSLNSGLVSQVIGKLRNVPPITLQKMLISWEKHTEGTLEIQEEVKELQSLLGSKDEKGLQQEFTDIPKKQKTRSTINTGKDAETLIEKVVALLKSMVVKHLKPNECMPFHEFSCFKDVTKLQSALIGNPRGAIQVDLLECHRMLKCTCCSKSGNFPSASMHDTSILYMLAQEHGDLINLHDWYQSFKTTIIHSRTKVKKRSKYSPSPKKRKGITNPQNKCEASLQAEFCRAVTELQMTGLIRMPSKRRPDYVQRVAFGI